MKTFLLIFIIAILLAYLTIIASRIQFTVHGALVPIMQEKLPAQEKADLSARLKAMGVYYSFSGDSLLVEKYLSEALTEKLRSEGFITRHVMPSLKDIESCPACNADRALLMLCSNEKSCADSVLDIDGVRDCYIRFIFGEPKRDGRWKRVIAVLYLSRKLSPQALKGICSILSYSFKVPFRDVVLSDEKGRLLIAEKSGTSGIDSKSSSSLWDSVSAVFNGDMWLPICRVSSRDGVATMEILIFARNERDLVRKDEIKKLTVSNLSKNGIGFSEKSDIFSVNILDKLKDCMVK